MRLILSGRHPRNSTYSTEKGQVLYKVDKPLKFGHHGIATIRKAVGTTDGVWHGDSDELLAKSPFSNKHSFDDRDKKDGDGHSFDGEFADSDSEEEAESSTNNLPVLEGNFAFYAQVEFRSFDSANFVYNGQSVRVKDYFRKEGWSFYGRGRVFKASDGKEYRWDIRAKQVEMVRNDGSETKVVRFQEYRPSVKSIMKGRTASLEVDPSCEPILDEIIMTFIFCHKLRKDRERNLRHAGH